jgi:hypothetical protein
MACDDVGGSSRSSNTLSYTYASAETVKRKLSILNEHCKSVGRDYDSILKPNLVL